MTVRNDDHIEKFLDVDHIRSKEEARKFLLITYAMEDCHVKTRYYVETFSNGKRIYLERPTFLNKGCDFVLFAEDVITCKNPIDIHHLFVNGGLNPHLDVVGGLPQSAALSISLA